MKCRGGLHSVRYEVPLYIDIDVPGFFFLPVLFSTPWLALAQYAGELLSTRYPGVCMSVNFLTSWGEGPWPHRTFMVILHEDVSVLSLLHHLCSEVSESYALSRMGLAVPLVFSVRESGTICRLSKAIAFGYIGLSFSRFGQSDGVSCNIGHVFRMYPLHVISLRMVLQT